MKTSNLVLLIVAGVFGLLMTTMAVFALAYISAFNVANKLEQGIKAEYENNKNVLSAYTLKVSESVQVPEMYKNDFKEVLQASLTARYGKEGSQATFQWLKEHNINFDASLYKQIQTTIEAGRNEFAASQTKLIDRKRMYETELGSFLTGKLMMVAGFPKINLDEYGIVVSEDASNSFKTGIDKKIKLRN